MNFNSKKTTFVALSLVAGALQAGCWLKDDCASRGTCAPSVNGGGSAGETTTGTSSIGGKASGGSGNSGTGGSTGTVANGGTSPVAGGTSATATTTAPCNGTCSGSTPICNAATNACVECAGNGNCKDSAKPICDTSANKCVGCLQGTDCKDVAKPVCNSASQSCVACAANSDCKDAAASRCDLATNSCVPCAIDGDCSQVSGKSVCNLGTCVQCTASNEQSCNANKNSCNPKTFGCTGTPKGSIDTCHACVADHDCIGGNLDSPTVRCVPLTFGTSATSRGGYCLQRRSVQPCVRPFAVLLNSVSLSGAIAEDYCGISQLTTTCEAVIDMKTSKLCNGDPLNCGIGFDALCKPSLSTGEYVCTIPCGSADQCLSDGARTLCQGSPSYCQ